MKKLLTTAVVALVSIGAFGQGVVNFSNASSVPGWANPAFDRYARWDATVPAPFVTGDPVSSNYLGFNLISLRAALYYAASTDFDPSYVGFVQAAGGLATFKSSTSATAGSWFGGNRTLDTIPLGTTANLVVLVWDTTLSTDPLSAAARGRLWGDSSIFQYTPPSNPQAQPSDFLMTGLGSFTVGFFPEPTTLTLGGLGAAMLMIARRSKVTLQ